MKLRSKIINFSDHSDSWDDISLPHSHSQSHSEVYCADCENDLTPPDVNAERSTSDFSNIKIWKFKGHILDPVTVIDSKKTDKDLLEFFPFWVVRWYQNWDEKAYSEVTATIAQAEATGNL